MICLCSLGLLVCKHYMCTWDFKIMFKYFINGYTKLLNIKLELCHLMPFNYMPFLYVIRIIYTVLKIFNDLTNMTL